MQQSKLCQLSFITYYDGQICSRQLYSANEENVLLYTMDSDESISEEHTDSPHFYIILEGELMLNSNLQANLLLQGGEAAVLPAQLRHSLHAITRCAYINIQGGNNMNKLLINKLPQSEVIALSDTIQYASGQISSKTLVQRPELGITLFAVDQGQKIRRHVSSGDALVQLLDGETEIEIGDSVHVVRTGQSIVLPANIPHALNGTKAFKMLLIVVKQAEQKEL